MGCYVVGKHLGKGSFADVWLAHHAVTGAAVAIKEINTGSLNAKLKQSLAGEVSIMQRVVHRNIVRLHETLEVTHLFRTFERFDASLNIIRKALSAVLCMLGGWGR